MKAAFAVLVIALARAGGSRAEEEESEPLLPEEGRDSAVQIRSVRLRELPGSPEAK